MAGLPIGELDALIGEVRGEDGVDGERVVIWAFSGGARLVGRWLEAPPAWLQGIALTYPVAPQVERVQAPVVLTRVGHEHPGIQATVDRFLAVAPDTEVIQLDGGQHGFDMLDHNPQSQQAITAAMNAVVRLLS